MVILPLQVLTYCQYGQQSSRRHHRTPVATGCRKRTRRALELQKVGQLGTTVQSTPLDAFAGLEQILSNRSSNFPVTCLLRISCPASSSVRKILTQSVFPSQLRFPAPVEGPWERGAALTASGEACVGFRRLALADGPCDNAHQRHMHQATL